MSVYLSVVYQSDSIYRKEPFCCLGIAIAHQLFRLLEQDDQDRRRFPYDVVVVVEIHQQSRKEGQGRQQHVDVRSLTTQSK